MISVFINLFVYLKHIFKFLLIFISALKRLIKPNLKLKETVAELL